MKSEKGEVGIYIIITVAIITVVTTMALIITHISNNINYGTKQGTIVDKRYNAPYTTYITSNVGKSTIRTPRYYPETYSIKIQKNDNGKIKECWIFSKITDSFTKDI